MNTALLIMAAGIGSRFGTGIKQLEPVDASDHITTRSMMQSRQASTMWYLLSGRISRKNLKRSSVTVLQLFAKLIM